MEKKQNIMLSISNDKLFLIEKYYKVNDFDSPQRILNNLVLLENISEKFSSSKNIRVLDLGCGEGVLVNLLNTYFKKFSYVGIDIKKRSSWNELENEYIKFFDFDISKDYDLQSFKPDLVISHATLEHVKNDYKAVEIFFNKFPDSKHLHLVPAVHSFFSYRKHGYRRYSIRTLKRISNKLNIHFNIYPLGNPKIQKSAKIYENNDVEINISSFFGQLTNKVDYPSFYLLTLN